MLFFLGETCLAFGSFVDFFLTLIGLGINSEPAAVAGALFVIRWGKDIDELSKALGFEFVDVSLLRCEGGNHALLEGVSSSFLE